MKKNLLLIIVSLFLIHLSNAQIPQLWAPMSNGGVHADGAIIKIKGDGSGFTTACSLNGTNGNFPAGHLVYNTDGMFYGQAFEGGAHNDGAIYRVDPSTNVYTDLFDLDTLGGAWVNSSLVRGNDSIFYGLVYEGGDDSLGQLFSFNVVSKAYSVLYHFSHGSGANPREIMMASNQKLYGVNDVGGDFNFGTLFSYDPATDTYADVFDFDSTYGKGAPVQAFDGLLYGLTGGGPGSSTGSIYSFDPVSHAYIKLHDFVDADGSPSWNNTMIQGTDSIFYGMTTGGGDSAAGVLFSFIPADNIYTKLYSFNALSGNSPIGGLIQASDGKLYGMTVQGGTHTAGTIFSFDIGDTLFMKIKDLSTAQGSNPYGGLTEQPPITGVVEHTASDVIQLYPNPVSNQLVLHTVSHFANAATTVSVFNALGAVIMKENTAWEKDLLIDTKAFSAGLYFVQITGEGVNWVGRFVKE